MGGSAHPYKKDSLLSIQYHSLKRRAILCFILQPNALPAAIRLIERVNGAISLPA
ncbi:MAG: hypothetical protein JXR73_15220 [Candidatus Omnitrophica bacterium]|nr:hypothetical protein [Candidatus Omnitrophota bacterium]